MIYTNIFHIIPEWNERMVPRETGKHGFCKILERQNNKECYGIFDTG